VLTLPRTFRLAIIDRVFLILARYFCGQKAQWGKPRRSKNKNKSIFVQTKNIK
jgi:hypothetical protein